MSDRVAFTWLKEGQKASNILMMTIISMILMQCLAFVFIQCLFLYRNIRHILSFGTKISLRNCVIAIFNHGCFVIEQIDDKGKCDKCKILALNLV